MHAICGLLTFVAGAASNAVKVFTLVNATFAGFAYGDDIRAADVACQPPTANFSTSRLSSFSTHSYTNHAGNAIVGRPVKLTAEQVALVERAASHYPPTTNHYPLSIFPDPERRRIAADYALEHPEEGIAALRLPPAVKRAIAGADKAMARSRKRAAKGLCAKEESDAFCAESEAALKSYLDKQVESGVITPAERKALGR